MNIQLSSHERIPLSIERMIRRTYGAPDCTLLTHPLITSITYVQPHEHRRDRWGSYSCCWGNEVVVELIYAQEGYGAIFGGRFNVTTDLWEWRCYAD